MASTTQIVPKFSFPYVETHVNDNTIVNTSISDNVVEEPVVRYIFPFISPKGIDNKLIKMNSRESIVSTYGETDYKKYGQPLMQALHVAESTHTEVWCMRVMPDSAVAASTNIYVGYLVDDSTTDSDKAQTDVTMKKDILKRKFRIIFSGNNGKILEKESGNSTRYTFFTDIPLFTATSNGRGKYGNKFSVRITPETNYEKDYGIKFYNFEILSSEKGVQKIANYVGCPITSTKYDNTTLINDILADQDDGLVPVDVNFNEEIVESVYNVFITWLETYIEDLKDYIDDNSDIADSINENNDETSDADKQKKARAIKNIAVAEKRLEQLEKNNIDIDMFDLFFGENVTKSTASSVALLPVEDDTEKEPIIHIIQKLTDDIDTTADDYDEKDYDIDKLLGFINVGSTTGIKLYDGSDGVFDTANISYKGVTSTLPTSNVSNGDVYIVSSAININGNIANVNDLIVASSVSGTTVTWDIIPYTDVPTITSTSIESDVKNVIRDVYIKYSYIKAFNGTYDKRIFSAKRIKCNALFDANYPMAVKNAMVDLTILRDDALCYLDTGIRTTFDKVSINNMITDYAGFTDYKISKNLQHYIIKEATTKKRVPVTITYFLARQYVDHIINNGFHIPFVKRYAQLTGHIKDSIEPVIDVYDEDIKEVLVANRFNYFETVDDNLYQRATQNTVQSYTSDLLEENNVAILYEMKRIIERDILEELYDFTDSDARSRFREYEKAKFTNWIGTQVKTFDIDFRMNEWEADRSILHCYLSVTFRGLQKIAILEIDINRRDASESSDASLETTIVETTEW